MSEGAQRRLTTIVAADIANFSRIVSLDEEGTLAAQRGHRSELIEPLLAEYHGRIANTAGDSFLLEFPSAVEAVRCAVAVQLGMGERNEGVPEDRRITYRIGINVGDVVADGNDLLGDGVNVAARLENLCDAGGIILSDTAYQQVRDRIDIVWEDGGKQEVKNIARPIQVWRWSTSIDETSVNDEPLQLPDKPSIAVLPFNNMSGDAEQDYFADGITEDIITELSRFQGLFVIARNTAFAYKGEKIDVPKVAAELGVHFVLEGSVRRAGDRVRITAQLIDGISGSHTWAERYDGKLEDVFDLQEEVTRQVVASVAPQIEQAERDHAASGKRRFDEAHDLGWRSYAKFSEALLNANVPEVYESIELAEQALALNGKCEVAYLSVVWSYAMMSLYSWGDDPIGAADRALEHAQAAMSSLPLSDATFFCLGIARLRKEDYDGAFRDLQRALEINPNNATALFMLSYCEATLGKTKDARTHALEALRLSPKDILGQVGHLSIAMAAFVEGNHTEFVDWAHKAIQRLPVAPIRRALMIAYAAEIGDETLLRTHLDDLNNFAPDFVASLFRGENRCFAKDEHMNMLLDGLRKAGLPEE
jgi:adenylate cyclase